MGTVIDGAAIPLIQNRVEDAGFKDVDIIPLGADKVFMHALSDRDLYEIVMEMKPFFNMIFSNMVRWKKEVIPFQRGAWIRLYGILLHAWNEIFFKLCVFECGRFLRTDTCSLNRERFDYARVLISTSSLDVVNVSGTVLVDGEMVVIEMIEEWGFNICGDACLYDEDDKSVSPTQENAYIHDDFDFNKNVENLADTIAQELVDDDEVHRNVADEYDREGRETTEPVEMHNYVEHLNGGSDSQEPVSKLVDGHRVSMDVEVAHGHVKSSVVPSLIEDSELKSVEGGIETHETVLRHVVDVGGSRKQRHKPILCSKDEVTSIHSRPWSVDWLQNIQKGDIGLISFKNKRLKKVVKEKSSKSNANKKKAGGVLRHPVLI